MKFKFNSYFLIALMMLVSIQSFGQGSNVTGSVTAMESNEPLPGVTIVVEGTTTGTVTDANGQFVIKVPNLESSLKFSFIGYLPQTISLKGKTSINVVMEPDLVKVDEVVVVGFGAQTKREMTGSVSKVKGDQMSTIASTNFQSTLQGLASGVTVSNSSGLAGAPVRIRVRGTGSIFSSGDPLYIIDGVPVDSENSGLFANTGRGGAPPANPMSNIDPNDIESIEVLKDAAASAIYGARAANGVIMITTKKGKSGKTKFSFSSSIGVNEATNIPEYVDGETYMKIREEAIQNSINTGIVFNGYPGGVQPAWQNGGYDQWFANAIPPLTYTKDIAASIASQKLNHWDDVFRTGLVYNSNISASGGNEKTQFFISGSYQNEEGILQRNSYKRLNGRANIDHQATEKLKIGTQISGSYSKNELYPTGPISTFAGGFNPGGLLNAANSVLPIFPKYNQDGTLFGVPQTVNNLVYLDENLFENNVEQQRYLTNIYADYKIFKSLSLRTELGNDFVNQINRLYMNPTITAGGTQGALQGVSDYRSRSSNTINTNTFFTFKESFKEHNFDLVAGNQYTANTTRSNQIQGNQLPSAPTLNTTQVASQITASDRLDEFAYLSFFSRLNYNFDKKYLFSMSIRRDGSSRFGANNRWANFPSLSAGWNISDEKWMAKAEWLSLLKIRASWGLTGNSNPGGIEPISYGGYGIGAAFYGGYIGFPFRRVPQLADNIRWERTEMIDYSIDFGFLKNQVTGSLNYYQRNTTDLILGAAPPPATGIVGGRNFENIAALENDGLEINFGIRLFEKKSFKWRIDANATYNANKVTSLGGLAPTAVSFGVNRTFVGMPLSTYWLPLYLGVDPATGFEVFAGRAVDGSGNAILDKNGYPQHDVNTRIVVDPFGRVAGSTSLVNWEAISAPLENKPGMPLWTGGLTNTFSYKGLMLSFLFSFNQGNWIYDEGARTQAYMLQTYRNVRNEFVTDRWTKPGDVASNPGIFFNPTTSGVQSSRFLYNGDYIRLRNVRLSYDLPKRLLTELKLDKVTVYANGTNLLLFSKFPGWDPEVVGTVGFQDFNNQPQNIAAGQTNSEPPQNRNISVGIQIAF